MRAILCGFLSVFFAIVGAGTDKPYSAGGVVGCIVFAVIGAIYAEVDLGEWREYKKGLAVFEAKKRELTTPQGFTPMSSEVAGVRVDWPIDDKRLKALAQALLNSSPFSESYWCVKSKFMTTTEFRRLQDRFETLGYIRLRKDGIPRSGYYLTNKGKAGMRHILASPSESGLRLKRLS